MGWNGLAFAVQGPGGTAGLWLLLKAWCLAPTAYHTSNIPFLGEVVGYEHWAQEKEKNRRKAIGLFTLKVKQNIGNMPLAMEYRNVFFPLVIKAHPQMKAKVTKRGSCSCWRALWKEQPTLSLYLGPNEPFRLLPRSQLSSLLPWRVVSASLTPTCIKLHWSEKGVKFRQTQQYLMYFS